MMYLLLAAQLTYAVPPMDAPMRSPAPLALALVDTLFDDVVTNVRFTGHRQRFARLRLGEANSVRVTVALDIADDRPAELYVDLNRDLVLTGDERVHRVAEGRESWEVSVAAVTRDVGGVESLKARRLRFDLDAAGFLLTGATLGWLEGTVLLGERPVAVRRRDSNLNGFFGDPGDQLWVDQDGDGQWSPFRELHTSLPFLTLREAGSKVRYAVRSNREGERLTLSPDDSVGRLQVQLAVMGTEGPRPRDDVERLEALFVGRDGSVVTVDRHNSAIEVPTGDYRLSLLTLRLKARLPEGEQSLTKGDPESWNYIFSEAFSSTEASWRPVTEAATTFCDPTGAQELVLGLPEGLQVISSETGFPANPYFYLGKDRLLVRGVYRGQTVPAHMGRHGSEVSLWTPKGERLFHARSGFA